MATPITNGHEANKPQRISTIQTPREQLWLEVVDFLKSMTFDEYIDAFKTEGFDRMIALYDINMDDLRDMKVKKGHAKILLYQIEQLKAKNALYPNKKVRFGDGGASPISSSDTLQSFVNDNSSQTSLQSAQNYTNNNNNNHIPNRPNLPIVDETKNHSPKIDYDYNHSQLQQQNANGNGYMIHHLNSYNNSGTQNYSGSQNDLANHSNSNLLPSQKGFYHSTINPRQNKLQTPPPHASNNILNMAPHLDPARINLSRTASARSDLSDEYSHTNDYPLRFNRTKSYTQSRNNSYSDAGTVVIRGSVADDRQSVYTAPMSPAVMPLSPAMPPIITDMHNDLHKLIDNLLAAKCENNSNYDEYHEALVSLTTNWDRERSEKNLKYLNAKHNYKNHVILDLLGVLNAQLGNTKDACKYHTQSIAISNDKYIEAMHNYAYLLHRIGDKESDLLSVKYYKLALNINSTFAHCWLHFGNLLEDSGKLMEAAEMYKRAIQIRPTNAAFHLDFANVLDDLNEFEEASNQYLKCIELQPNDAVYHWNYAISLENQCFFYKAEEAYKRAINLDFECIDAHINYAHMLCNQPNPQYRKAIKEYELILKIPDMACNTEIMLKLAKLYDHFGQLTDETEEIYMSILQLDPSNEDAYILFATYLTNQNRIEDANACYQAGIRHIQSDKLQGHYIIFLKEIQNGYNNKPKKINHAHGRAQATPRKIKLEKTASYVPPSPFVSYKTVNDDEDELGFDYFKPANAKEKLARDSQKLMQMQRDSLLRNKNKNKNVNDIIQNSEEPGCIVM